MPSVFQTIVKKGVSTIERKLYMKRVEGGGNYETNWQDISGYVVKWGAIKQSFGDNSFLGDYDIDGFEVELDNSSRKFNDSGDPSSFFSGYRTRYRTKFKIVVNYLANYFLEFSSDSTAIQTADSLDYYLLSGSALVGNTAIPALTWHGILYSDTDIDDTGTIKLSLAPLIKVFENYKAIDIEVSAGTTADLVSRLYNKAQGATTLFNRFFEVSPSINPDSLSVMTISSPLIDDNDTVWDKIIDYSRYDDFFPSVSSAGGFVWDKKSGGSSIAWKFYGGVPKTIDTDYCVNIITVDSIKESLKSLYTSVSLEYSEDNFAISSQSWAVGDGSIPDIYGERLYKSEVFELSQDEAQTMADNIRATYGGIKKIYELTTVFLPAVSLKNLVSLSFMYDQPNIGARWNSGKWDIDVWGGNSGSIYIDDIQCFVVSLEHDLDNLTSKFILRGV